MWYSRVVGGTAIAFAFVVGCGSDSKQGANTGGSAGRAPTCEAGSEGCACYGNGTCDGTLTCASHFCVSAPGGAGAPGSGGLGGEAGAAGQGANAGAAGAGAAGEGGTSHSSPLIIGLPEPWQCLSSADAQRWCSAETDATASDEAAFDGATDGGALEISYPLDGALVPPNVPSLNFQWSAGVGYANGGPLYFRLSTSIAGVSYGFLVRCAASVCSLDLPISEWLSLTNQARGQTLTWILEGSSGAGQPLWTAPPLSVRLALAPLDAELYFEEPLAAKLRRARFGARRAVDLVQPGSESNAFACTGCHSVARNGQRIGFAVTSWGADDGNPNTNEGGEYRAAIQFAPIGNGTLPAVTPTKGVSPFTARPDTEWGPALGAPIDQLGLNVALSPDGSLAAVNGISVVNGDAGPAYLELRDTATGTTLVRYSDGDPLFGGATLGIHPEFSPDGTRLALTLSKSAEDPVSTAYGSIGVMDVQRNGGSVSLGPATVLVAGSASSGNCFSPTWSPDGQYLAYVRTLWGRRSHAERDTVLMLVAAEGGSPVPLVQATGHDLAVVSAGAGVGSRQPKFAPSTPGDDGLYFLGFVSDRSYGWLRSSELRQSGLWLAAIDRSLLGTGDPSLPPTFIPYQSLDVETLAPSWSEVPECPPTGRCLSCGVDEACLVDTLTNRCDCVPM